MLGKPKIGIDIDGCLAYMIEPIRQEAHYRFGIDFKLEDIKEFGLSPQGMTREQIVDIIEDPIFLLDLPVIYYAKQALLKLMIDFEVHLVTARSREVGVVTRDWLLFNNLSFDVLKVGHDCKVKYAKEIKLPIFIEDRYRNALELAKYCDTVYMINKTYNLDRPVPENIIRVEGWHEILEYLYADRE